MSSLTGLISGGGGGTPVNSIAQLFVGGQAQYTDEANGVWLKTGNTITPDASTYPDATVAINSVNSATYDDVSLYVGAQMTQIQDLTFNSDGTIMYAIGSNTDSAYQYFLDTPFDLSTGYFSGKSFLFSSQDSQPYGIRFNADGTKMFMLGSSTYIVYQYSLSTANDVSTATYDSVSFSFSSQDTAPRGFTFNPDGTKMFMIGAANDRVYEYTLSTAFDISTVSYTNRSFDISTQEGTPNGLAFSTDGTKMFILGQNSDRVHQYTLSTGFLLSGVTYDNFSVSVSGQTNVPQVLNFSSDGTKMYTGYASVVYQYSVGNAFDLRGASYDSKSHSVTTEQTLPTSVTFNNDGTKMFVVGISPARIDQYSLATAFDASTATYDSITFAVGTEQGAPTDLKFNPDGTKMFILGYSSPGLYQYSLSTAFDISTATYDNVFYNVTQDLQPSGFDFNSTGTRLFIIGRVNSTVYQYNVNTAYNVSSISYSGLSILVSTDTTTPVGIIMNYDDRRFLVLGLSDRDVNEYYMNTANNVATAIYTGRYNTQSQDFQPQGFGVSNDGTKMYIVGWSNKTVHQYSLTNPRTISSVDYELSYSVNGEDNSPFGFEFNNDGTKMYMVGTTTDIIYQYTLPTAFDLSTARYAQKAFSVSAQDLTPTDLAFNNNGTKMYLLGQTNRTVYQYSLGTAFDVSTAAYDSVSFSVTTQDTGPQGLQFSPNGSKLFIVGSTNKKVYQYSLGTPFDISTTIYDGITLDVLSQDNSPLGITFGSNGTKLFMLGSSGDNVYQYSLSGAYNLIGAVYDGLSFYVGNKDSIPRDLRFNTNGTKLYVLGGASRKVYQYSLSEVMGVSVPTGPYDYVKLK